jgi:hypothetical protein
MPFLDEGERVRQVLVAEAGLPPDTAWEVFWFSWLALLMRRTRHAYRLVCVTDRAVVVLESSRQLEPRSVLARCPRNVYFGPLSGGWAPTDALGGRLYINRISHTEAAAADADLERITENDWTS